jgi:hypothetical protein
MTRYFEADLAWFGVDNLGHAAAFITAGTGPIPASLLDQADLDLPSLEQIANQLPKIGAAHLVERSGNMSSFVALAERGFFVFDWADVHRLKIEHINAYERVCTPATPLILGNDQVQFAFIRFQSISFEDLKTIPIHEFVECEWPIHQ